MSGSRELSAIEREQLMRESEELIRDLEARLRLDDDHPAAIPVVLISSECDSKEGERG